MKEDIKIVDINRIKEYLKWSIESSFDDYIYEKKENPEEWYCNLDTKGIVVQWADGGDYNRMHLATWEELAINICDMKHWAKKGEANTIAAGLRSLADQIDKANQLNK